jgi:hypothetical protein
LLVFSSLDTLKKEKNTLEEKKVVEPSQENKKLNRIDIARESLIRFIRDCNI